MPKDLDRCTGHCCEQLTIPLSPDELWAAYHRWERGGAPIPMNGSDSMAVFTDIHLIAPMLEHLGAFENTPIKGVNPTDAQLLGATFDPPIHFYRCKHFDPKARVCTIYEHRPTMCREYPYGRSCNYRACTWGERREKRETPKQRRRRLVILQGQESAKSDKGGVKR